MRKSLAIFLLASASAGCNQSLTEFKSEQGKFTVLFPGTPEVRTEPGITINDMFLLYSGEMKQQKYEARNSSGNYQVHHYDVPENVAAEVAKKTDKVLEKEASWSVLAKGSVDSSKAIKLQDRFPGLEYQGSAADLNPDWKHRGRAYVVNRRVYNILWMGPGKLIDSEQTTQFLQSFKVTE
jgi:hypothetical protein